MGNFCAKSSTGEDFCAGGDFVLGLTSEESKKLEDDVSWRLFVSFVVCVFLRNKGTFLFIIR